MKLFGFLIILSTLLINGFSPRQTDAKLLTTLTGKGELCSADYCFPIQVDFDPAGGEVVGWVSGSVNIPNPPATDCLLRLSGTMNGIFEGGDGGLVSGTFVAEQNITCESGSSTDVWSGSWNGNFYANGTGSGVWSASTGAGTWSIWYEADQFSSALATPSPTNTSVPPTETNAPEPSRGLDPTATPTSTPTAIIDENVQAFQDNEAQQQFAQEQIAQVLSHDWTQGPYTQPLPFIVWLNNRVVTVHVDESQQPYVMDQDGNTVKINPDGQPLEPYDHLGTTFSDIPEAAQVPPMDLVDYLLVLQQHLPEEMAPYLDGPVDILVHSEGLSSEDLKIVLQNIHRLKQAGLENNIEGYKQVINRYLYYQANVFGYEKAKQDLNHELEHYGMAGLMEHWKYLKEDLIRIRQSNISKPELIEKIDQVLAYQFFYDDVPTDANLFWVMQEIRRDQYAFERMAYQKRDAAFDELEQQLGEMRLSDAINQLAQQGLITEGQAQLYQSRANQGDLQTKDIREISKQHKTLLSILEMQTPPPASPTGLMATDALLINKITITLGEMFDD